MYRIPRMKILTDVVDLEDTQIITLWLINSKPIMLNSTIK